MKTFNTLIYILFALTIVFSAANILLITGRISVQDVAEQETPARLEIIKIVASSCEDCFDAEPVAEQVRKSTSNITSERSVDFSSPEGQQLIEAYHIERLPTVIVSGEVNKSGVSSLWRQNWNLTTVDDIQSYVYSAVNPPYVDAEGNVRGVVSLTHIIDPSCKKCASLAAVIGFFKKNNVKFSSEKTINYTSPEAQELISKFAIQKIPALIISKDITDYESIAEVWPQLNVTEKQGFYALHTTAPPYRDTATNQIKGFVDVIYLKDETCSSCYDVRLNNQILVRNFGIVLDNETVTNMSSEYGKSLLKQYNITKVPVIIVSPDAAEYERFIQVWPQAGSVEKDGWYVMRNPGLIGSYRDLAKGIVVNEITVYGGEFEFQPSSITVNKGETVRLSFVNAGTTEHDLVIDELGVKTSRLQPRASETVEFVANQTGTFSFYCSVEGHRQQGMQGNFTII